MFEIVIHYSYVWNLSLGAHVGCGWCKRFDVFQFVRYLHKHRTFMSVYKSKTNQQTIQEREKCEFAILEQLSQPQNVVYLMADENY
jgi:hypothetical protein